MVPTTRMVLDSGAMLGMLESMWRRGRDDWRGWDEL